MAYDEDLADRVRAVLAAAELVTERQMFGGFAFVLRGHMFCGVVKDTLMARLGPSGADRALNCPHVRPMDFTGRPMRGMVFVEPGGLHSAAALRHWVTAADYTRSLPPKPAAPPARKRRRHHRGHAHWQANADLRAARAFGPACADLANTLDCLVQFAASMGR